MGDQLERFKELLSEVIAKQSVILGPEIAVLKARTVQNIEISKDGKVLSISGDPREAIQRLIDVYVNLSGQIVKSALSSVFAKYPEIKNVD